MKPFFLILALMISLATANAAESAKQAIERLNKLFEAAHVKGDAKALASQYTEDAQAMWENEPTLKGRDAIEKNWRKMIGDGGRTAKVETLEVQEAGDWAYETGNFLVTEKGNVIHDGKYLLIWKKVNGQWFIHRECGNANRVIAQKP